ERLPELRAIHANCAIEPAIEPPRSRAAKIWTRDEAIVELLRGRLTIVGPTTASALAASLDIDEADACAALLALESEGVALRGAFGGRSSVTPESQNRGRESADKTEHDIEARPQFDRRLQIQ